LVLFRRKIRPWKIEYDAVDWELSQAERNMHPVRARYRKIARRILIWVPGAMAAFVLFFFPVTTHLLHPRWHYVGPYRVSLPWTATALPLSVDDHSWVYVIVSSSGRGRFGITPLPLPLPWETWQPLSAMIFGSKPWAGTFDDYTMEAAKSKTAAMKELRLGDEVLICWQYRPKYFSEYWRAANSAWNVGCEIPAPTGQQRFYASFHGRAADLPDFYEIIEHVKR
jgi:hypothetical protein